LPVKTSAPENEDCLRFIDYFNNLRTSLVRENLERLTGLIHAAKYDRSGVDSAVIIYRRQNRRSPSMVPVLACTSEFLPYLLANLLRSLEVFFHFEKCGNLTRLQAWFKKFTTLTLVGPPASQVLL
jgi:hypothetical protein